jgi:hypothetical protein
MRIATVIYFVLIFMLVTSLSFAQTIVDIEPGAPGLLNTTIMGDTMANGDRNDPNTIYRLKRNGAPYFITETIENEGYHLQIVAEEGEGIPPIIRPWADENGNKVTDGFRTRDQLTLKGLYFLGYDQIGQYIDHHINVDGDDGKAVIDSCWFEYTRVDFFRSTQGDGGSYFVTNTKVRNGIETEDPRPYWPILFFGRTDTVWVENCTFYNFRGDYHDVWGEEADYLHFNHNTTWTGQGNESGFADMRGAKKVRITNNIIINYPYTGTIFWNAGALADSLKPCTFHMGPTDGTFGWTDADRDFLISNNNVYLSPAIADYLTSKDTTNAGDVIDIAPLHNSVSQKMIDTYDNIVVANMMNMDPQFTNPPDNIQQTINYLENWFFEIPGLDLDMATDEDAVDEVTVFPWAEDFSYSTSSPMYTAGTDGLPLGDLNWFDVVTSVEYKSDESANIETFALNQNYPNPFNPETRISYSIEKAGQVKLTIFNLLGEKVKVLFDGKQLPGKYAYTWNATDRNDNMVSSGIYFYQLQTDSKVFVKRMLLLK